jgi:replication-associated recombination protein RarA
MSLNIHKHVFEQLNYFNNNKKIPNIIFYGPSGSGKRTIVKYFINLIYNNNISDIKTCVMFVNCSNGKGIQFVREDIKFFSKTNINNMKSIKIIILSNADKLTIDAQTALRRSIELYSITTRFFLIVEDKNKLINPIISRFCDLYIPLQKYNNLHKYFIDKNNLNKTFITKHNYKLKKILDKSSIHNYIDLINTSNNLYQKGFSSLDIINYINNNDNNNDNKDKIVLLFSKIKSFVRNEKLLISIILNNLYLSSNIKLENVLCM